MDEEQLTKKEKKEQRKEEKAERHEQEAQAKKSSRNKTWTIIIVSAIIIFAGLTWLIQNRPESSLATDSTPSEINVVTERDWTKGGDADTSKITIVEYSDFQCPTCGAYYPMVKQLVADFGTDIRFVYRHLPIQGHTHAMTTAQASEAAGLQGKFFEMHDKIFETQGDWTSLNGEKGKETFFGFAEELGLDMVQFEADFDSEEVTNKINADRKDALGAGAPGTPTFYFDGVKMDLPGTLDNFKALVNTAIADKAGAPAVTEVDTEKTLIPSHI